jgi:branched-chain amino acid transport system substrate-binding protein
MVSGANTLPPLTSVAGEPGADWQPGFFRAVYNDIDQGLAAATFAIEELGVRRAAVVHDGDPFPKALTDVFARVFTELGGDIVFQATVNKGDTNMEPVLAAVAMADAELLFFPIYHPAASYIVLQAKQIEALEQAAFLTTLKELSFIDAVGEDGIGVYFIGPTPSTGAAYDALLSSYEATYEEPPSAVFHAQMYDATNLLLTAIATVAVQDQTGGLHIGRAALRETLYGTTDFAGVTGILRCDRFGDCGPARFDVVSLVDPAAGLEGLTANVVYSYTRDR